MKVKVCTHGVCSSWGLNRDVFKKMWKKNKIRKSNNDCLGLFQRKYRGKKTFQTEKRLLKDYDRIQRELMINRHRGYVV